MAIDNEILLSAIDAGREQSYGTDDSSTIGVQRARCIEAYLGFNTNPAPAGRSQVVDRSVYETISTIIPSLVRIFANTSDDIVKFLPVGPDDEQAAEQTTAIVHHVVTQLNQWEQICTDWIHDACVLSNGYVMAWWDKSETKIREKYEGQSDDQIAMLLADSDLTVLEHTQEVDEEATNQALEAWKTLMGQWSAAVPVLQQQGQPIPPRPERPKPIMSHDVTIEREQTEEGVCLRVLPPENCFVHSDTPNWTLQDCPYFEFVQLKTISDLRAMGLDVPEDISDNAELWNTLEEDARNRFGEDSSTEGGKGVMRLVNVRSIWVKAAAEDDVARMYYVIMVGRTILYAEQCNRIHVASMTPQPLPHRHYGLSLAELVLDIQEVKTAIKRGGLDNLYLANNGRHVISSRVNLDDFLDARPGGVVRMLDDSLPAEGHIIPLTHPMAFDSIIGSLEYFDQERQLRSGASRAFAGSDAGAINKTASGMQSMVSQASMRVEHIARMMAPAIENLFSIVHELIQKHENKTLTIKVAGKWIAVDPQAWRTKRDVKISVGVGAGNKEAMQMQLNNTLAAQLQTMPLGLAGPEQMRNTMIEMNKLAGFANPDKFWKDAEQVKNAPPVPNPEQIKTQAAMQLKQMELQADAQKFQAETEVRMRELQMQSELKLREQQASLALQATNDERDAQREALNKQMEAQLQIAAQEQQKAIAEMKAAMDKYTADLEAQTKLQIASMSQEEPDDRVDKMLEQMKALAEEMAAPATLLRDPATGKAVGVQKGSRTMRIQRGPDGRAIGLQ